MRKILDGIIYGVVLLFSEVIVLLVSAIVLLVSAIFVGISQVILLSRDFLEKYQREGD